MALEFFLWVILPMIIAGGILIFTLFRRGYNDKK